MDFNEDAIKALEVKPRDEGWYKVTLFQYAKEDDSHPSVIREYLFYDGENWDYCGEYKGSCYVCFISEKVTYE